MARPVAAVVAFLLLAVVAPGVWWLSRPGAAEGPPVATAGVTRSTAGVTTSGPPTGPAESSTAGTAAAPTDPGAGRVPQPVRLQIRGLGVTASIDPVGVGSDGSMVIPADGRRIGWYRFGPAPGAVAGSAVLAGHVDTREQGPGALFNLRRLGVGDQIEVTRQDGSLIRYRVIAKQTIVKQRLPTESLFARDGSPRLVVITCGGPFVPELGHYSDNVVVIGEPLS